MRTKTKFIIVGFLASYAMFGTYFYTRGREDERGETIKRLENLGQSIADKGNRTYSLSLTREQRERFLDYVGILSLTSDYLKDGSDSNLVRMHDIEERLLLQADRKKLIAQADSAR